MRRIAYTTGAVASAAVAISLAALWVRSEWVADVVGHQSYRTWTAGGETYGGGWELHLVSCRGGLRVQWASTWANWLSSYAEPATTVGLGQPPASGTDPWRRSFVPPAGMHQWYGAGFVIIARHYSQPGLHGIDGWHVETRLAFWVSASAVMSALLAVAARQSARATRLGLCRRCGYDLRGTPDRCPECGGVNKPADVVGGPPAARR